MNRFFCWFLLVLWSASASAGLFDRGHYFFKSLTLHEGVSSDAITSITQDAEGYIWYGTQHGLYKYDGYKFTEYQSQKNDPTTLSGDYVRSLWPARDGGLWIGTLSNGVSRYHPESNRFTRFMKTEGQENSLSNNRVEFILEDEGLGVWFATDAGLDYLDLESSVITHYNASNSELPHNRVRSLALDHQNRLWVGSFDGLSFFDKSSGTFSTPTFRSARGLSLGNKIITALHLSDGRLWVGTYRNGAYVIDLETFELIEIGYRPGLSNQLSHKWVSSILEVGKDEVWVATFGGGINVVEPDTGSVIRTIKNSPFIDHSLNANEVRRLFKDRAGLIWITTWGGGINQYYQTNNLFRILKHDTSDKHSLSHGDVYSSLNVSEHEVWVGTRGRGIDILNPKTGLVSAHRPLPESPDHLGDGNILTMIKVPSGHIWVGTREGLYEYSPSQSRFRRRVARTGTNSFRSLFYQAPGLLWIGTNDSLIRHPLGTDEFEIIASEQRPDYIDVIDETGSGHLLVGASNGVFALSHGSKSLRPLVLQASERKDEAAPGSFKISRSKETWFFSNAGIEKLTKLIVKDDRLVAETAFVAEHKLISDKYPLEDAKGRFWFDRNMFDPETGRVHSVYPEDGIRAGVTWAGINTETSRGTLLFGTTKGLLMIKPDLFQEREESTQVLITDISIDGQRQSARETLQVPAHSKSLSIEFSSDDYSAPTKNTFRFKLGGFDDQWIEVDSGRRVATYTNLPPGSYRFVIQTRSRAKDWLPPHELRIEKHAKWHEYLLFKVLGVLGLLAAIYYIYRYRILALEKREWELEALVSQKTAELEDKNQKLQDAIIEIKALSLTDQLTGAYNRRFLDNQAAIERSSVVRGHEDKHPDRRYIGYILIDIDNFKSVNDDHGHDIGDRVLQEVTRAIKQSSRPADHLIRLGGEEFLLMARVKRSAELKELAERTRQSVERKTIDIDGNMAISRSCSIGYVHFPLIHTDENMNDILKLSDKLLYVAKQTGKNKCVGIKPFPGTTLALSVDRIIKEFDTLIASKTIQLDGV
ncbi:ligand-binding sensor domain-containing diguanylate cyclase [Pseudoteredinibacter isoporae]|uniref:ligand-binding sensor domain-containing diguanylate cyclase n=1 Tax=Pseudoteredinibacter isoporae TaxID=570281 RepID=UPI0031033652